MITVITAAADMITGMKKHMDMIIVITAAADTITDMKKRMDMITVTAVTVTIMYLDIRTIANVKCATRMKNIVMSAVRVWRTVLAGCRMRIVSKKFIL